MKTHHIVFIVLLASAAVLSACAANNPRYGSVMSTQPNAVYGTVEAINLDSGGKSGMNAGTVIGGVAGAAAGNQFGSGKGNTLATIAGAIGGAVAGTAIENSNSSQIYHITIRLDNGNEVYVNQAGSVADLRVGDRVRIANGNAYQAGR